MNRKFFTDIAPLLRDKIAWDAFIVLLEYYESKEIKKLQGVQPTDELIRVNGVLTFLQHLKTSRDNMISAEKEFVSP